GVRPAGPHERGQLLGDRQVVAAGVERLGHSCSRSGISHGRGISLREFLTATGPVACLESGRGTSLAEVVQMLIGTILRNKGSDVATVAPQATVRDLLAALAEHNIGAVVVSEDGVTIDGIVSERDVVRRLHDRGAGILDEPVSSIMTAEVRTVTPADRVDELRETMTTHRIRHVPVVENDRLAGIVSIGDVVKSAIDELETEKASLVDYLH